MPTIAVFCLAKTSLLLSSDMNVSVQEDNEYPCNKPHTCKPDFSLKLGCMKQAICRAYNCMLVLRSLNPFVYGWHMQCKEQGRTAL